jgi:protein SDA1
MNHKEKILELFYGRLKAMTQTGDFQEENQEELILSDEETSAPESNEESEAVEEIADEEAEASEEEDEATDEDIEAVDEADEASASDESEEPEAE